MNWKIAFVFVLVACFGREVSGQHAGLSTRQLRMLDSIAARDVPKSAPGIATGIVRDGEVIYEKVAGYASLTDSSLIMRDTRFNIASNGKQFTALAILRLVQQEKVALADDIRKFFPSLFPHIRSGITIEHLLNHSSGIRDVYDLWSLQGLTWWEHSFTNADALALLEKQEDLNFLPGTQFLYSNSNYILLAEIVAKVSGVSFVAYTNELFQLLDMPNTSFADDFGKIAEPVARPYFNFNSWVTYDWIWNVCGDGNMFTTLADQLQWEKIIQGGSSTLLPRELILKSQEITSSSIVKNYGYGLEFGTYKERSYRFHEGATGAWKATVVRFPDEKVAIVTLTNSGKVTPAAQTRQMANVVLDLPAGEEVFSTEPERTGDYLTEDDLLGVYMNDDNFSFQFVKDGNELLLRRPGRSDTKLKREGNNIFQQWNDQAFKLAFQRSEQGEMQVTAYYPTHPPYSLTRPNGHWSGFDYQSLNGRYSNQEIGVTISIQHLSDRQYRLRLGEEERTGLLVTPEKMIVDFYQLEIVGSEGKPDALLLNGDRVRALTFLQAE